MTTYIVSAGQTNSGTTLNSGDSEYVSGTAYNSVLNGGAEMVKSGGTAIGVTINSGGLEDVYAGGVTSNVKVLNGGVLFINSGGEADSLVVSAGGKLMIDNNALLSGAVLDSGAVVSGWVLSSGQLTIGEGAYNLDGLTIQSGANIDLEVGSGAVVNGLVNNGDNLLLDSGAVASGLTVNSGGILTGLFLDGASVDAGQTSYTVDGVTINKGAVIGLEVGAGAATSGFVINGGGYETVDSGGTAIATVLASGNLEFLGSAGAANSVVFNDAAGSGNLLLNDAQGFAGTIIGLGLNDTIDLTNISSVTAVAWQNGVLAITLADGSLVNLNMQGNYQNAIFGFSSDNNNGTLITLQSIQTATVSGVGYDAATGVLTLNGSFFTTSSADYTLTDFTLQGNHGSSYTLTSGSQVLGTPTSNNLSIQLSAADQLMVNGLLNNAGSQAVDGSSYNLSATAGWNTGAAAISTAGIGVSNAAVPAITTVSYNAATGELIVTGSQLVNPDAGSGLAIKDFSISAGNNSYAFVLGDTVSNLSSGGFTLTLDPKDKVLVNQFFNADGNTALSGDTYNFTAHAGWDGNSSTVISTQAVSVNNVATPSINNVVYDAASGILTLDGANLTRSAGDYLLSDFTLQGDGGSRYSLTSNSVVLGTPDSSNVQIQLSAADQLAVNGLLNSWGTQANDGSIYNLSASKGWDSGAAVINTQAVNVSNITPPAITAVTYDAALGMFTVTGSNLVNAGSANGIMLSDFIFSGGSGKLQLSGNETIGNLSANGFTISLNSADTSVVNAFINANGSSPLSGAAYNLSAAAGWDSDSGAAFTTQSVTVNGLLTPVINNVSYNAATGVMTLNGSNLSLSTADYNIGQFSFSGDGGKSYNLNSSTLSIAANGSSATIQLSGADQLALDGLLNKSGTAANDGKNYAFNTAIAWDHGYGAATAVPITVSNVVAPSIATVSYNAASGEFTVVGSHFNNAGLNPGLALNHLTFSGGNGGSFSFNAANDTLNNFTANGFSIDLGSADKTLVNAIVTANGNSPLHGAAYNLTASANWDSDSGAAITQQAVTASYVAAPAINSVAYNAATGVLTLTGQNFTTSSSDYLINDFTLKGNAGGSYTLSNGSRIIGTPAANTITIQLSAADQVAVDGLLNKAGSNATDGSLYNLAAVNGWDMGAGSINAQGLTVSNVSTPTLSVVSYNAASGVFSFTGNHLVNAGNSNGIALADFTLTGGGHSYTFNATTDAVSNLTGSGFTLALGSADAALVNGFVTANGSSPLSGAAYNLTASANWDSGLGAAISTQGLNVSGIVPPVLNNVGYNAASGLLTFTGSNLTGNVGDYKVTDFTLTGDHGISYTLSSGSNIVLIPGVGGVSIQLSAADQLAVNGLFNQNGLHANDGSNFKLSTGIGWDSAVSAASSNAVTVNNVTAPVISAVSYNAVTGVFSFTGNHLVNAGAGNGVTLNGFKFTDNGNTFSFNSSDTLGKLSASGFNVNLSASDKLNLNALINDNGSSDLSGHSYNFSTTANWDSDSGAAITTQSVIVSNAPPTLSSVSYNAATGVFVFTGVNLVPNSIILGDISLTDGINGSFSFSPAADAISNASSTGFTVTLSSADQALLSSIITENGSTSLAGGVYSLSLTGNWDSGSALPISNQSLTVSGAPPVLLGSTYDAATGLLTLDGANLTHNLSDYNLSGLTLQGDGNTSFTLSQASTLVSVSADGSGATLHLSAADQLAVDGLLNSVGNQANDGTTYNLSLNNGWDGSVSLGSNAAGVTVANVTLPTISAVGYDAAKGIFTISGSNLVNAGSSNGIALGAFALSSDLGNYTFDPNNDAVSKLSANGFTVSLSTADKLAVNAILNQNGSSSLAGTTYSLAVTSNWDSDSGAEISSQSVAVVNLPPIVVTASYDAASGQLTLNGANLTAASTDYKLTDISLLGDTNINYTLSSGSALLSVAGNGNSAVVQLSAADQLAVDGLLNNNGTLANDGTVYNVNITAGWDTAVSPLVTGTVSVKNVTPPTISAVSYDAASGIITVSGAHLDNAGNTNGINLGNLTLSSDVGSYTFDPSNDVISHLSANGFSVKLSIADQLAANTVFNLDGSSSMAGVAYNLSAGAGWDSDSGAAVKTQAVNVTNVPPALGAASYDASTGQLQVTGGNLTANATDYVVTDFILQGEGGISYSLSKGSTLIGTPGSSGFSIQLSAADQVAVDGLLNNDGLKASDGFNSFYLSVVPGWDTAVGSAGSGAVTVSNVTAPSISGVSYNAANGEFTVTGSHLVNTGSNNGVAVNDFTFTGGTAASISFQSSNETVSKLTANSFIISLNAADKAAVNAIVNADGNSPLSGAAYSLSNTANWDSNNGAANAGLAVTASNVATPAINSVAYNAANGVLTVSGQNFTTTASQYSVTAFSLGGDGGASYTLTSGSALSGTPTSTSFSIQLSPADQLAVDGLLNNSGMLANDGTAFNLAALAGWDKGASIIDVQAVTVSNVTSPTIYAVSYDASTGEFTFSGSNLVNAGNNNGIAVADFTLTGSGGQTYTFNPTADSVSNLTTSGFTLTLNSADQAQLVNLLTANGATSLLGDTYNLSFNSNWDSDNGDAVTTQGLNVTGIIPPVLTSVNYDASSGILTLTGNHLTGAATDYPVTDLVLHGDHGISYTLTNGSSIYGVSGNGTVSILLSAADQLAVDGLFNQNGGVANDGSSYSLSTTLGWDGPASTVISHAATASNVVPPAITGVSYDVATGIFNFTGTNLVNVGVNLAVQAGAFTFADDGGSYTFNSANDALSNFSSSGFSISLGTAGMAAVNALVNDNGNNDLQGVAYNISSVAGWNSDSGLAITTQGVSVSNAPPMLTGVAYDASAGVFTFTGVDLNAASLQLGDIIFNTGNKGSLLFNAADTVGNFTANGFTVSLNNADMAKVNTLVNANGNSSLNGTAYTVSTTANWDNAASAAISKLGVTASGVASPAITNVGYDAASGILTLTGTHLSQAASDFNAVNFSLKGEGGSYTLSSASTVLGTPDGSSVAIQLSAADQVAVDGLFNNNGTAAINGSSYNLSSGLGWDHGLGLAVSSGVSVSNVTPPSISAVAYNAANGDFTVSGSHLANFGTSNGIAVGDFSFSGGNGSNVVFNPANETVSQLNANSFVITLNAADKAAVNAIVNTNGTSPQTGAAYNLGVTANWDVDSGAASPLQAVTASFVNSPAVNSVAYNAATGVLTIGGQNLTTISSDYKISDFTLKGDGGNSYTLTSGSALLSTPTASSFNIQLSAADQLAVDGLFNKAGATANDGSLFNLATLSGWDSGATNINIQAVTVSNVTVPTLSTVSYNAASGVFSVTGNHLVNAGSSNGIALADLTLSSGGQSYTFNADNDTVSNLTANGFTINVGTADKALVANVLTANGSASLSGAAYNLSATANWDSDSGAAISNQSLSVSGIVPPVLNSSSYNAASGVLTLTGINLTKVSSDYKMADIVLKGDHGISYTLTSGSSVQGAPSGSSVNILLSAADQLAVDGLLNQAGKSANDGSSYSLITSQGWDSPVSSVYTTGVTVSNVTAPVLSSVSYNAASGVFSFSGSHLQNAGSHPGILLSDLKFSDEVGSYSFNTSGDNISQMSATGFTVTLNNADKALLNTLVNANGNTDLNGVAYNIATTAGWDSNSGSAITTQSVTVNNAPPSLISSVSYDASAGVFSFTGSGLNANTLNLGNLTVSAGNSASYTFNSNNDVIGNFTNTGFTVTLSGDDQAAVNIFALINGKSGLAGAAYNLAAGSGWDGSNSAQINTLPVLVTNVSPIIIGSNYNAATGILTISGANLTTALSDYNLTDLTLQGDGGNSYSLGSDSILVGVPTVSSLTVKLSTADQLAVDGLLNNTGIQANDGSSYSLSASGGWDGNASISSNTGVAVNGVTPPTISKVSYDASSGILFVTGNHLVNAGGNNGINLSNLTLTSDVGSYTFDPNNDSVSNLTATGFSLTLSTDDQTAVNAIVNLNGTHSLIGTAYNLAAGSGWDSDSGAVIKTLGVTVANLSPNIVSATYNAASGQLFVQGANLTTKFSDYNLTDVSLQGSGGSSYSLSSGSSVQGVASNGTAASIQLSVADRLALDSLLNNNGAAAGDGSTYNLSTNTGWDGDNAQPVNTAGITVSNVITPTLSTVNYNAATGLLQLTGSNLTTGVTDYNIADFSVQGDGSNSYSLTNSKVTGTPTSAGLNIQLSATDQLAVNGLLNSNGQSAIDGTTFNLATANGWDTIVAAGVPTTAVTVSNFTAPVITAATYNATAGTFTFTGSNFTNYGSTSGIQLGNLTFTDTKTDSFTFSSNDTVTSLTATSFTITLNNDDKETLDRGFVVKPTKSLLYDMGISANWDGDSGAAIDTLPVAITNVLPNLDSASYDASTGQLTLTGNYLTTGASGFKVADFTLTGDGKNSYTLSAASKVLVAPTSSTESLTIQLSAADQLAVGGLFNNADVKANDNTLYNLSTKAGWDTGALALNTLGVTVSNVTPPTISGVSYNAASGVFSVTGANLVNAGSHSGVTLSDLSISAGSSNYTFNGSKDLVSKLSATGFQIALSKVDQTLVNAVVNNLGGTSLSGAAYSFNAANLWDSDSGAASQQSFTVSKGAPSIGSVAYNGSAGVLTIVGGYLTSAVNNFKVTDFTLSGQGGMKYTLTAGSKLIAAPSQGSFNIQLSSADQLVVNGLLNHNGTQASDKTSTYNLSATAGWDTAAALAVTTEAVTVNHASTPTLSSVSYNAVSGVFNFTGAGLTNLGHSGGITVTDFKLGAGSSSFSFTGKDAVSKLSSTGFTVTLSAVDKAAINLLANANGLSPLSGTAYNISSTAGWNNGGGAAIATLPVIVSGDAPLQVLSSSGMSHPDAVAVDTKGDVFIADYGNNAIKELVAGSHVLTTLSTTNLPAGVASLSALSALSQPTGLAVDSSGDLFVADAGHKAIDEVFAGTYSVLQIATGLNAPAEVAVDGAGNVYFADSGSNTITEIKAGSHALQALVSGLKAPAGVAVDGKGDVFFTDSGNNALKELVVGTSSAVTLASTGLKDPTGLAIDSAGNLYVVDSGTKSIKEIAAGSHAVTTLLSTGLNNPQGITLDSNGNLYVADTNNNAVKELVHTVYNFNTSLTGAKPVSISALWENTQQIELSKAVFTAFAGASTVSSANFSNSSSANGASDYLYYNAKTGGLYYDANGTTTEIAIVGVGSHPAALSVGDFKLIA